MLGSTRGGAKFGAYFVRMSMVKCAGVASKLDKKIMLTLQVGVQTISLGRPLKTALLTAAKLGADAVEIDARTELCGEVQSQTAIRQFRKMLEDLNLSLAALAYPTRHGYDTIDRLEARIAGTKEAMQLASALGAPVVVNQIGHVPSAVDVEEDEHERKRWNCLCDVLSDLGYFGDRQGAVLAAETGNEPGSRLAELIQSISAGSIAVTLNPGNLILGGFTPLEAIGELGSLIRYVRARDAVRQGRGDRGSEVALGRGSVDPPALLGGLEEQDYRGTITIERRESTDSHFEIGQAVQYLRNL